MLSMQRREQIKKILLEHKNITVTGMAQHFGVSTETIRRDFTALSEEGFLDKTYGGATLKTRMTTIVPRQLKAEIMVDNKRRMAARAAKFIQPNDCIFLDHSTTVYEICNEIEKMPLTVMTNSLSVINRLAGFENIRLVMPGGNFDCNTQGFFGLEAVKYIQHHSFDKAFVSCRTLDMKKGLCDSDEQVAEMRRNIIYNSDFTYLLADNTKFGSSAFVTTCDFTEINYVITDKKIDPEWCEFFKNFRIRVCDCEENE